MSVETLSALKALFYAIGSIFTFLKVWLESRPHKPAGKTPRSNS